MNEFVVYCCVNIIVLRMIPSIYGFVDFIAILSDEPVLSWTCTI